MEQEGAEMKEARKCRRFYCDYRGDRYCCVDCWNLRDCPNPCLNHPVRCGLEDKGTRIRMDEVSKIKT